MSLLPHYDFPKLFSISSAESHEGVVLTFDSPMGVGEKELDHAPNMADLLELLPEFDVPPMVSMFAKAMSLPRVFTFRAEPKGGHAQVVFTVTNKGGHEKTWTKDFSKERISVSDLVDFAGILKEGVQYQRSKAPA